MANFLLGDRLAPITSEFGLIQTDPDTAAQALGDWFQSLYASETSVRVTSDKAQEHTLSECLARLAPLTSVLPTRFMLVATRGNWTAYFENRWPSADAGSKMGELSRRIGVSTIRITAIPDTIARHSGGRYGATILQRFDPKMGVRSLEATNDGGIWSFSEFGTPLQFEDVARYKRRRSKDRFDIDLLSVYLEQLAVRAFDEDWYSTEYTLISLLGLKPAKMQEYSLEEARRRIESSP